VFIRRQQSVTRSTTIKYIREFIWQTDIANQSICEQHVLLNEIE